MDRTNKLETSLEISLQTSSLKLLQGPKMLKPHANFLIALVISSNITLATEPAVLMVESLEDMT